MAAILNRVFNLMSEFEMYKAVSPYFYREVNRKLNITGLRRLKDSDPDIPESLAGKVCVMTGGSRGIGVHVVQTMLKKDCHVITTSSSKDPEIIEKRRQKILAGVPEGKGQLEIWHLDLTSMESTINFAKRFKELNLPLNYFVACAGVMFVEYQLTQDGFEKHFALNYLSQILLLWYLLPELAHTAKQQEQHSRIVLVSSCAHFAGDIKFNDIHSKLMYSKYQAYGQSKLALVMFGYKMAKWLDSKDEYRGLVKVFSLHPGLIISTGLWDNVDIVKAFPALADMPMYRTPKEGAETIIYAALSTELNKHNGKYLEDSAINDSSLLSMDEADQDKLWKLTWALLHPWRNPEIEMEQMQFVNIASIFL